MKKLVLWGIALCVCVLLGLMVAWEVVSRNAGRQAPQQHADRIRQESWVVSGKSLVVEVVSSPADVALGLGGRTELAEDAGMLFDLGARGIHPFWMKGMHIPIDIIWLDRGVVVFVAEQVPPPRETQGAPRTIVPPAMADQVLELSAGGAARFGLRVGVSVR